MSEQVPSGQESQFNPKIAEIKKLLGDLPPEQQRSLIGDTFLELFRGSLSATASQELRGVIERSQNPQLASNRADFGEINNIEDEWLGAVSDIALFGKFPQGVDLRGKEIVGPIVSRGTDFEVYSPTGWRADRTRATLLNDLICCGSPRSIPYPEASMLSVIPDKDSGYSALTFSYMQDTDATDLSFRWAMIGTVFLRIPTNTAQQIIQTIKDRADGADIAERFIQKATPGVIAKNKDSKGIKRAKSSELFIFDEDFQRTYFGNEFVTDFASFRQKDRSSFDRVTKFRTYADQHVTRKRYSIPVGDGVPRL